MICSTNCIAAKRSGNRVGEMSQNAVEKKQRFDIFDIAQQGSSSGSYCPGGPCLVAKNEGPKMGWKKSSTREGERYYRGIIGSEVMVGWILRHISFA